MSSQAPPASQNAAGLIRVIHCRDGVAVAEVGRICIAVWRGSVTDVSFEWQRSGLAQVVARYPQGVAFMCVIEPTAKPPRDELRRSSTQMIASHGARLKCVAVVIEGEGFGAAITRGVISGMALLHTRQTPADSFSDVRTALRWIHDYIPIETIAHVVAARVEELRILLDAT
jgi:hypothetical protein